MLPYWLLFSVFAAGALQNRRQAFAATKAGPLLVLGGLLVALLIGLRYEVGADWTSYIEIYEDAEYMKLGEILEWGDPGYQLLNLIVYELGGDIWMVNLVCGLIFAGGLLKLARVQPNPWLAVLVAVPYLVIVVAMGYSRQAVAIGILMAGLAALTRTGSVIHFAIYVAMAAPFHKTAVVILPLVALSSERNRWVNALLIAVMGYILYDFFIAATLDKMMNNYIDQRYASQGAAIRVSMNLIPAALFLLFQKRFGFELGQQRLWRNFSLAAFGLLALLLILASSTVVDRIALYVIPLQLVVLSRLPDAFPINGQRNPQLVLLVVIYSAAVQYIWLNYAAHAQYWLPYQVYPFLT